MADRAPGWLLRQSREVLGHCKRGEEDLRAYQSDVAIPFLMANPRSAAYLDMGLGKSVSILTVLDACFNRGEIAKALIIAPVRVAVQTWPTEMRLWRHAAWMQEDYSLIRPDPDDPKVTLAMRAARRREKRDPFGSPNTMAGRARTAVFEAQRKRAVMSPARVHIINREAVTWLVKYLGKRWHYDCIIVDESTSFSDHKSSRWKHLAHVAPLARRIHLLSGTPAPEGVEDLFAQIYLLDQGKRFGRSITQFRRTYLMQHPYKKSWTPQLGAVRAVADKISDIALVMRSEDYLSDLKGSVVIERPIVLDKAELVQYRQFQRNMILQLVDAEIEAVNAGVLAQKLLQWCSGAVYDADRKVHYVHDHKLEEMREVRDENPGKPVMVAYWFKSSLDKLRRAFPRAVVMDRDGACVTAWNAGRIEMLLVHPQSAGHGLNMQFGPCDILVYYDTPASLELYLQLNKRLDRPGQKRLVRIVHFVVQKTLEQFSVSKLRGKEDAQNAVTDRLRAVQKQLLQEQAA